MDGGAVAGGMADAELIDAVEAAIGARGGDSRKRESAFTCPEPEHHQHGDAHPSARYNSAKRTWWCPVGNVGGGYQDLARRLGLLNGTQRHDQTQRRARRVVATYPYRDEHGAVLFEVLRFEPRGFGQRRPDGNGGYVYNLTGTRRALYRLPELRAADAQALVHVVEGERDADALVALGLVATTNPGGAGKWKPEYSESLRGRRVIVIPDNDTPGRQHAAQVAASLGGIAVSVQVLTLPDLPPKGDISDWLAAGGSRETLEALVADVENAGGDQADAEPTMTVDEGSDDAQNDADEPDALPTFPEAAWRGVFDEYRQAMAGTSEADDSVHFAAFWAMAAARLRRRVWTHYAFPHFANVFLVNLGPTGDGKTSAMRQAVRAFSTDALKLLRGVGSAEGLADWMTPPEGTPLVSHVIVLEELAALLLRGKWDGATLVPFLTETFDTPDVYEVPFRKNPIRVPEPTPTLLAGSTPEWFWRSMREHDFFGGFGNRIFYLVGRAKAPIPMPTKPAPAPLLTVQAIIEQIDTLPSGEAHLAPDAADVWREFYLAWKGTRFDALTAAATKRIPTYAIKLALLYAVLERTVPIITADQVRAAILVGDFGAKSAAWLVNQRQRVSPQGQCEEAVIGALEHAKLPMWKIHQRVGGRRFTAEDVTRAVRALLATGAIIETGRTPRGGAIYARRGRAS